MSIINYIRSNDTVYVIHRILSASTTEEEAVSIKDNLELDYLIRDNNNGKWYCCMKAQDAIESNGQVTESSTTSISGSYDTNVNIGNNVDRTV